MMVLFGVAAAGAIAVVAVNAPSLLPSSRPAAPMPIIAETSSRPARFSTLLNIAKLTPEACAAIGLSIEESTSLATRAREHLTQNAQTLQQAVEADSLVKREVQTLEAAVRRGEGEAQQLLAEARDRAMSAERTKNEAVAGLFVAATRGLDDARMNMLRTMLSQKSLGLPTQYLTTQREQGDAVALRDALADQRIARREGREPSAEPIALIERATDDRARAADANLQNIDAYRTAWRQILDAGNR